MPLNHYTAAGEHCNGCGKCVASCPTGAITLQRGFIPVVNGDKCNGCGCCVWDCPDVESEAESQDATA